MAGAVVDLFKAADTLRSQAPKRSDIAFRIVPAWLAIVFVVAVLSLTGTGMALSAKAAAWFVSSIHFLPQ